MQIRERLIDALSGGLLRFDPEPFVEPAGEPSIVGPGSMSWRVFANPVSLVVGGIAAVLLELGELRVRAGVWKHSSFRVDPKGRMQRTGLGAMITVYAARSRLAAYAERVNAIHAQVAGTTQHGTPYRADDPELLAWVQATAAFAFLEAYRRLVRPVSEPEEKLFYREAAIGARYYGVVDPPRSPSELHAMFERTAPCLEASPVLGEFLHIMRTAPILPRVLRRVQPVLVRGAMELVPKPLLVKLGLGGERRLSGPEHLFLRSAARIIERLPIPGHPRRLALARLRRGTSSTAAEAPPRS